MYTEENEKRDFPLKDFLLKLILVIVFVLLLVWLLPKFITPTMEGTNVDLSPLTNQLFADNLKTMQDAATNYFTDERLPKEVGDKVTITLREMIGNKLVVPFTDKKGKACDVDKSYVTVTKADNEYVMKVNLKCSEEEDYVLVHMGCYTYCESDICKKTEKPVVVNPSTPKPKPTPDPIPEPKPPVPPVPGEKLIYEYYKTNGALFTNWTNWSNQVRYQNTDKIYNVYCNDYNNPSCTYEREVQTIREKVGTKPVAYVRNREKQQEIRNFNVTYCAEYEYQVINNVTYQVSAGNWVKEGVPQLYRNPTDSAKVMYQLIDADYRNCGDTCQTTPDFYYQKWVYTGSYKAIDSNNYDINTVCKKT
ncbi:MAG: hypothetical protein RSE91_03120, partial [Bacilli bacterium]